MPYGPGTYEDDWPTTIGGYRERAYGPQQPILPQRPAAQGFDWRQLLQAVTGQGLGLLDRGALAAEPYANAIQRRILALRGGPRPQARRR